MLGISKGLILREILHEAVSKISPVTLYSALRMAFIVKWKLGPTVLNAGNRRIDSSYVRCITLGVAVRGCGGRGVHPENLEMPDQGRVILP